MPRTVNSQAKAKAIAHQFETVYQQAAAEGVDLTQIGWDGFSERLMAAFKDGSVLKHLASYALNDAHLAIRYIQTGLPEDMPADERRRLLHDNADRITRPPASMIDSGKNLFFDGFTADNADYYPPRGDEHSGLVVWRGFDFDYYTSSFRGCPALDLEPSDVLPQPDSQNFLDQFFHLAIDAAFNDPAFMQPVS